MVLYMYSLVYCPILYTKILISSWSCVKFWAKDGLVLSLAMISKSCLLLALVEISKDEQKKKGEYLLSWHGVADKLVLLFHKLQNQSELTRIISVELECLRTICPMLRDPGSEDPGSEGPRLGPSYLVRLGSQGQSWWPSWGWVWQSESSVSQYQDSILGRGGLSQGDNCTIPLAKQILQSPCVSPIVQQKWS